MKLKITHEDEEDLDRQEFTQLLTVLTLYVANNNF
jgi:hypothetical protein